MGIYDAAKDAAKILKDAGKIEEYVKILDLIEDLFEKQKKIESLEEENNKLRNRLLVKDVYHFKNNAYYQKETNDGPFCTRCFDKNHELIRIIPRKPSSNHSVCPECKNDVNLTGLDDVVRTYIPGKQTSYE